MLSNEQLKAVQERLAKARSQHRDAKSQFDQSRIDYGTACTRLNALEDMLSALGLDSDGNAPAPPPATTHR
jgi:hypothetical protein